MIVAMAFQLAFGGKNVKMRWAKRRNAGPVFETFFFFCFNLRKYTVLR